MNINKRIKNKVYWNITKCKLLIIKKTAKKKWVGKGAVKASVWFGTKYTTSDTGKVGTEKHTDCVNALLISKGQDHMGTVIAELLVLAAKLQDGQAFLEAAALIWVW